MSAPAFNYRLQPPRMGAGLTAVLAGTAIFLFAPLVYWLTLPDPLRPAEQLSITDVEVPLECEPTAALLPAKGWYCGDTTVTITEQPGVADGQLAAQRALRNIAFGALPTGASVASGDAFLLADAPSGAAALVLPAPGAEAGTAFVVTFEGADAGAVVGPTWQALTGEELPGDVATELERLADDDSLPALPQADPQEVSV